MCLQKITKTYNPIDMNVRKGYKIMRKDNYTPFRNTKLNEEWLEAVLNREYTADRKLTEDRKYTEANWNGGVLYETGFHVYPTRAMARKALCILRAYGSSENESRILRKVEIKGIMLEGTDATSCANEYIKANILTTVARWIRLVPGKV